MRIPYLIFSLLFALQSTNAQEDMPIFFNEFSISLNRTDLEDNNTENLFGFGLGAYRSMFREKNVNLILGIEYNITRQFKKESYEGRYARATDVKYTIHNLSIPLCIRYNVGSNTKFFIELGAFIDLIPHSKRKGTMYTVSPGFNNFTGYKKSTFNEKIGLTNLNYGFSGGFGLSMPFKKKEVYIKTDYKLGLNELSYNIYNRYLRLIIGLKI